MARSPAPHERDTLKLPGNGGGSFSALWTPADSSTWTFVYAPGAGSNLDDPFGAFAAELLATRGVTTLRFQFPYMEAGRRGPDRPPVLAQAWRQAIAHARERARGDAVEPSRLVVGGRSMGGRIASMVVAEPDAPAVDALALFAYPLHPPKKPAELRTKHLASIAVPTLFVSGTKDAFGSREELTEAARAVARPTLRWLDGADHGYAIAKSSGRTREDVWRDACDALTGWLATLR